MCFPTRKPGARLVPRSAWSRFSPDVSGIIRPCGTTACPFAGLFSSAAHKVSKVLLPRRAAPSPCPCMESGGVNPQKDTSVTGLSTALLLNGTFLEVFARPCCPQSRNPLCMPDLSTPWLAMKPAMGRSFLAEIAFVPQLLHFGETMARRCASWSCRGGGSVGSCCPNTSTLGALCT